MRTNKTGGFTLIELLIVIAIIGILAAVLIPNLMSARARAFDTAAQACAKGAATAAEIYFIDEGTYVGLTPTFVGNNGGNACNDTAITLTMTPANQTASAYEGVVTHSGRSGVTWTVTPAGIVTTP